MSRQIRALQRMVEREPVPDPAERIVQSSSDRYRLAVVLAAVARLPRRERASVELFVDFQWEDGANRSGTVAVTGLALDNRVASVELTRPISPPVKADIVAGTFILLDINLNEGTREAREASSLTVRGTHGDVLTTLSLPI